MQKNEIYLNSSNITNNSKELSFSKNIKFIPQLEKDIYILINYIRTNPLDFSNNLIKKNKNKTLTEEQIEIIKFLEEKYNKEQLLPFHEIPEISEAAKNLLYTISQNDSIYSNKNLKKLKPSSLNLRTRLSNYGLRTGRIFENVIFEIDNTEDIINHILKDENGRNMLLSNKMKFIGIGSCLLPTNQICSVIDIVQDFIPYKKSKKNNIKFNNYINSNINNKESDFSPKMNIIINNTNNNNEYIPNILSDKHSNQRKKNLIFENSNHNINNNDNIFKTPDLSSRDSNKQNSYKSYNIIINNNKIIPIRNNLNNINELNDNKIPNNGINSTKIGLTKSKSVYGFGIGENKFGFKFNSGNRGSNSIYRYQKLNRKEKLEILHKINQRKNNNSMIKNNSNFQNLIPLSPDYTKKSKSNYNLDKKYISPVSSYYSKKIYSNIESDINNIENDNISNTNKESEINNNYFEFNETTPNYPSPNIEKEIKINELKNDLDLIKNQIKKELKIEVKNELKNEMQQEYINNNKNKTEKYLYNINNKNYNRNNNDKSNLIYHKRYKSDFFQKNKNVISPEPKNNIKENRQNYQSFNNKVKNIYIKDERRIKNKNEIKKLIRLYNQEKDIKRSKINNNEFLDIINNNKINKGKKYQSVSKNYIGYKNNIKTDANNKNIKYNNNNVKPNLFLIKYQKARPVDQTFKLTKNKTNLKNNISKLCLNKEAVKQNNNPIINNNKLIINNFQGENNNVNRNNSTMKKDYIINSSKNRNNNDINNDKNMKDQSIELYLNNKENKRYKTPENSLNKIINYDNILVNPDDKRVINNSYKASSYYKPKINLKYFTQKN